LICLAISFSPGAEASRRQGDGPQNLHRQILRTKRKSPQRWGLSWSIGRDRPPPL